MLTLLNASIIFRSCFTACSGYSVKNYGGQAEAPLRSFKKTISLTLQKTFKL